MRHVLKALDAGEPLRWIPARHADAFPDQAARPRRALALAAALVLTIVGAGLAVTYSSAGPQWRVLAGMPVPRLEQMAGAVLRPVGNPAVAAEFGRQPPVLSAPDIVDLAAGARARLSAHVANSEGMQPESIAVVRGLPGDVRLTEGIMIGPGLWMLRPNLLASVELEADGSASGSHVLELELRTPDGSVVSAGQTLLAIAAAPHGSDETQATADEIARKPQAEASPASSKPRRIVAPAAGSLVRAPTAKARSSAGSSAKPKVRVARPVRRTTPQTQSEVTTLASRPAIQEQPARPPRLVWPGDDPRSASYLKEPPVFLGGFLSGSDANTRRGR